jgi:hypothetical protein
MTLLPKPHKIGSERARKELLRWIIIGLFDGLFLALVLGGCAGRAEPKAEMPVVQITDNRVITINRTTLQGDNNTAKVVARPEAEIKPSIEASPSARQDASQTTKSGMWIVWLVVLGLLLAAGAWLWWKWKQ